MTPFRHCEEIRQLTDDEAIWYPAGIATPSARNDNRKGLAMTEKDSLQ